MSIDLSTFEKEEHCYLTTRRRVTGNPHESALYLISGGGTKSDCLKNLLKEPQVRLRVEALLL